MPYQLTLKKQVKVTIYKKLQYLSYNMTDFNQIFIKMMALWLTTKKSYQSNLFKKMMMSLPRLQLPPRHGCTHKPSIYLWFCSAL